MKIATCFFFVVTYSYLFLNFIKNILIFQEGDEVLIGTPVFRKGRGRSSCEKLVFDIGTYSICYVTYEPISQKLENQTTRLSKGQSIVCITLQPIMDCGDQLHTKLYFEYSYSDASLADPYMKICNIQKIIYVYLHSNKH